MIANHLKGGLPLNMERIDIDLDDGVGVNYNRFGEAIKK